MRKRKQDSTLQNTKPKSPSTGTSTAASSTSEPTSPKDYRSSATYHTTVYKLPLDRFIELTVTEDLKHLVISGEPNVLELQDAFEQIINEYSAIVHTDKSDAIIRITKRIGLMQHQIIYVEYALSYLAERLDKTGTSEPSICTELRRMGYNYKFDPSNTYQYLRELGFVRSRAKTLIMQRRDLLREYNRMTQTPDGDKAPKKITREQFELQLADLWKFMGSKIDKFSTMTSEYAAVLCRYNQAAQAAKKQANNGRR